MSAREPYGPGSSLGATGTRSPRGTRRIATELPTVDRSPSRTYPTGASGGGGGGQRNSPVGRRTVRPGAGSPDHHGGGGIGGGGGGSHQTGIGGGGMGIGGGGGGVSSSYYRDDDLNSPVLLDDRGRAMGPAGGASHRSRSASRPVDRMGVMPPSRYQSLDRNTGGGGILSDSGGQYGYDRDYRSFDRDRGYGGGFSSLDDDPYGAVSSRARQSPGGGIGGGGVGGGHFMSNARDTGHFLGELQHQNTDLHRELSNLKKELELTNQKLGSSMHSIKTFWSPELKKERALRKEESAKYSLINDQLKLLHSENQVRTVTSFPARPIGRYHNIIRRIIYLCIRMHSS
ncbi:putative leucine-rich repeat-containing protein isoform X11 [Aphis craccivora]|uniref:Putative leucine-rich repeat-containing protein isoform X11 n=1 Tax=Aphis craccivora TaxID=307492 RepID=A0A6G0YU18_APHCR|nr:putative leucine-rich repeat-containing protein isoform X11 [Aphis craccivora]